jgi:hypothetical protein
MSFLPNPNSIQIILVIFACFFSVSFFVFPRSTPSDKFYRKRLDRGKENEKEKVKDPLECFT